MLLQLGNTMLVTDTNMRILAQAPAYLILFVCCEFLGMGEFR